MKFKHCIVAFCLVLGLQTSSEQFVEFGTWQVHYSLVNSTFLTTEIAARYGVTRAANRAILTVSILNESGESADVAVSGSLTNLLGQTTTLTFKQIHEGTAVYQLTNFVFTDREVLKFEIVVDFPDGKESLKFSQEMFKSE